MKKKLFMFVLPTFFITLINLGAQIRGAQTQYTIDNFGLNQPLTILGPKMAHPQNSGSALRIFLNFAQ